MSRLIFSQWSTPDHEYESFYTSLERPSVTRLRRGLMKRPSRWCQHCWLALWMLEIAATGWPAWWRRKRSPFQRGLHHRKPGDRRQETRYGAISSSLCSQQGAPQQWPAAQTVSTPEESANSLIERSNQSCPCKKNSSRVCDQPVTSTIAQARRAN